MKLPKIKTRTYVDWGEYSDYLRAEYQKDFDKHRDSLWMWFTETSSFHNGCFVMMEPVETLGYTNKDPHGPAINWFADRIFKDYPNAVQRFGNIDLWVRW